jgi:hypothetical protein
VAGEAALDVISRHLLLRADRAQATPAQIAFTARQHGRHDDRLVEPVLRAGAGGRDGAADLVAECERQGVFGAHAIVEVAQVGVANTAAGDRNDHLAGAWNRVEGHTGQRCVDCIHQPAMGFDAHGSAFPSRTCRRVVAPFVDRS